MPLDVGCGKAQAGQRQDVNWTCSSPCLLTDVRRVKKKYSLTVQHPQTYCSMLFEALSGRMKIGELGPNSLSCCALFHCKVKAENIGFFYCTQSTC